VNPRQALGEYANEQQRSFQEVRSEAETIIQSYLEMTNRVHLLELMSRETS
jgi:hypothetical protein